MGYFQEAEDLLCSLAVLDLLFLRPTPIQGAGQKIALEESSLQSEVERLVEVIAGRLSADLLIPLRQASQEMTQAVNALKIPQLDTAYQSECKALVPLWRILGWLTFWMGCGWPI